MAWKTWIWLICVPWGVPSSQLVNWWRHDVNWCHRHTCVKRPFFRMWNLLTSKCRRTICLTSVNLWLSTLSLVWMLWSEDMNNLFVITLCMAGGQLRLVADAVLRIAPIEHPNKPRSVHVYLTTADTTHLLNVIGRIQTHNCITWIFEHQWVSKFMNTMSL